MYSSTYWYRGHIVVLTSRSCRGFRTCVFIRELMYSASIRQVPLLPLYEPLPLFACPSIGNAKGAACIRHRGNSHASVA